MTTTTHTHRASGSKTVHAMQYRDLAVCGAFLPDAVEHEGPVRFPDSHKCVACTMVGIR